MVVGVSASEFSSKVSVLAKPVKDDGYEENDTFSSAYLLPDDIPLTELGGIGVQMDEDWYKINVASYLARRVKIECLFLHNNGDIDIALCDGNGSALTYAWSVTDNEYLDFEVDLPGTYYIRVYSGGSVESANTYDLRWKALPTGEDLYEPNNTLTEAFAGLNEGVWLSSLNGPGLQNDDDWYRINVSDTTRRRVVVDCLFTHSEGDIDIKLIDAAGQVLVYPWTSTDNEKIDFVVPSVGSYYVLVCFGNAGNAYDLRWITQEYTPPKLSSVAIVGPDVVNENTSAAYKCIAYYADGSSRDVTPETIWGENSSYTTISSIGVLTASGVLIDQMVTVSGTYSEMRAEKSVTIADKPPVLNSLSIEGSDSIDANSVSPYRCIAHYSDGSTADVTELATWSESSTYTTISGAGVLSAGDVGVSESVTVTASYAGLSATRSVMVLSSVTLMSYQEWLFIQEVPETMMAYEDQPADDGIPNLLKYACGLSALSYCTTADLLNMLPDPVTSTFSIRYSVSKSAFDVYVEPLFAFSPNGPWYPVEISEKIGEDSNFEFWKASVPMDGRGFMRLRAVPTDGGLL